VGIDETSTTPPGLPVPDPEAEDARPYQKKKPPLVVLRLRRRQPPSRGHRRCGFGRQPPFQSARAPAPRPGLHWAAEPRPLWLGPANSVSGVAPGLSEPAEVLRKIRKARRDRDDPLNLADGPALYLFPGTGRDGPGDPRPSVPPPGVDGDPCPPGDCDPRLSPDALRANPLIGPQAGRPLWGFQICGRPSRLHKPAYWLLPSNGKKQPWAWC